MKITEYDYKTKRDIIRSAFNGDHSKSIDAIVDYDVNNMLHMLDCVDIMREVGYTREKIREQFYKTAKDGFSASEIIKSVDGNIIGLSELDTAYLMPRMGDTNGKYKLVYVQYPDTPDERILNAKNVMYMSMPYTFTKIQETINNGL